MNMNHPQSRNHCCSTQFLGSGTFDNDGRVSVLQSSNRKTTDSDYRYMSSGSGYLRSDTTDIDNSFHSLPDDSAPIRLVYEDDNVLLSLAADAPNDVMESLKELSSTGSVVGDDDGAPPMLTSSESTKSSIASVNSPGSSVCSADQSSSDEAGGCYTTSQEDELSTDGSFCSSDEFRNEETSLAVNPTTFDSSTCLRGPPDVYGQTHPIESSALIATKLHEFDHQLQHAISIHTSSSTTTTTKGHVPEPTFLLAERKCPNVTTPSFKIMFLRCECFHVDNAMKRYARYWDKRVELFGPIRAYQPITLESLYAHNDHRPLEIGSMQIIQRAKSYDTSSSSILHPVDATAPDERNILWFDASKVDPTQYTRESGCRVLWYIFHSYLEDVQVQQRGLICINYSAHFSLKNRDPPFTRMCLSSIQGCLPIRISVFHGCHPPTLFRFVIRLFLLVVGERLRKRIVPHSGTNEHVNNTLQRMYNIQLGSIPTEMGGKLSLNVMEWVRQRQDSGM